MELFTPKFQGRPWISGQRVLHGYALPSAEVDTELLDFAAMCRPLMDGYPIDPLYPATPGDPGLLHITIDMVADAPSAEIIPAERDDLIGALGDQLAGLAPFTAQVGPPIGNIAGIVFDVWPDAEVLALQERMRAAMLAARGPVGPRQGPAALASTPAAQRLGADIRANPARQPGEGRQHHQERAGRCRTSAGPDRHRAR